MRWGRCYVVLHCGTRSLRDKYWPSFLCDLAIANKRSDSGSQNSPTMLSSQLRPSLANNLKYGPLKATDDWLFVTRETHGFDKKETWNLSFAAQIFAILLVHDFVLRRFFYTLLTIWMILTAINESIWSLMLKELLLYTTSSPQVSVRPAIIKKEKHVWPGFRSSRNSIEHICSLFWL